MSSVLQPLPKLLAFRVQLRLTVAPLFRRDLSAAKAICIACPLDSVLKVENRNRHFVRIFQRHAGGIDSPCIPCITLRARLVRAKNAPRADVVLPIRAAGAADMLVKFVCGDPWQPCIPLIAGPPAFPIYGAR